MKIEIDGIMLSDCSRPPEDWDVTIDGEKHKVVIYSLGAFRKIRLDVEPMKTFAERNMVPAGICIGVGSIESDNGAWWTRTPHKEEKKMLNFDKYREEVKKRAAWAVREGSKNPKPAHLVLKEIIIGNCLPYMNGNELVDWLFEEFELPLLNNGYGLKPGDWIMVREHEHDSWDKMRFVCFADDLFYVIDDALGSEVFEENGTNITGWKQARLPEDGE